MNSIQKPQPRQVHILEPIDSSDGSSYRHWLENMRSFRQYHVTREQYDDWFLASRQPVFPPGQQRHLIFTMPTNKFCLVPDQTWTDMSGGQPSARALASPFYHPTHTNMYRAEGITVQQESNGVISFTSSYHLRSDTADTHIVTAAFVAWPDPLKQPRRMHIARHIYPQHHPDAEGQAFIDTLAEMNSMVIFRFLHTLEHRRVRVIELTKDDNPYRPINRQQRKAEDWNETQEHRKIYIPATINIYRAMQEVAERPTARRGYTLPPCTRSSHYRRDGYCSECTHHIKRWHSSKCLFEGCTCEKTRVTALGRKRIKVNEAKVHGGTPIGAPPRIYSAHNVGLEGLDE